LSGIEQTLVYDGKHYEEADGAQTTASADGILSAEFGKSLVARLMREEWLVYQIPPDTGPVYRVSLAGSSKHLRAIVGVCDQERRAQERELKKVEAAKEARRLAALRKQRQEVEKKLIAEQKRLAAEEAAKAKKRDRLSRRRLYELKIQWLRYLSAYTLGNEDLKRPTDPLRLILYLAASRRPYGSTDSFSMRTADLAASLASRDIKLTKNGGRFPDAFGGLKKLADEDVSDVVTELLQAFFWHAENGPAQELPDEDVAAIAAHLEVPVEAWWKEEQCGPLTENYWNLHTKDQLVAIAAKHRLDHTASQPKRDLVALLMTSPEVNEAGVPKELLKAKPVP